MMVELEDLCVVLVSFDDSHVVLVIIKDLIIVNYDDLI